MKQLSQIKAELREAMAQALDAIRQHKMRSGLTILGIVIGISTVITMSSVINGLNTNVMTVVEDIGSNIVFAYRFNWARMGHPSSEEWTRPELSYEDGMAVKGLPHVVQVAPGLRIFNPMFGEGSYVVRSEYDKAKNVILEGNAVEAQEVFNVRLAEGRWFNNIDRDNRRMVTVLGYDTAETLFPGRSAVGREVFIENQAMLVIGVAEKQKNAFGAGSNPEDNIARFPIPTFLKLHPEHTDYLISVKVDSPENMPRVIDSVRDLLRRRRGLRPEQDDNFAIFTQDAFTDLWKQVTGGFFILMFSVAAVALLVGGIGVMNIMLMSVTERTREIGVRKAMGARRRDILWQFILEAMILTGIGGVLGIVLSSFLVWFINGLPIGLPAVITAFWVGLAFAVAASVGLFFGIYPAWKAAQLDPVVALRYE